MKNIYILALLLLVGVSLKSQINLNTQYLGSETYDMSAPEYINMLPGFEYIPQNTNFFKAYIDPFMVVPPTGGETGGPIAGDDGIVGALEGNLSVNGLGAALYSIPIKCMPGVAGMQPSISLTYNSSGPDGFLGPGWALNGISEIMRTKENKEGINSNEEFDSFVLDGVRLIGTGSMTEPSPTDVRTFHTEQEDFSNIKMYIPDNYFAESYFEIQTKSGLIYTYGGDDNSRRTTTGYGKPISYLLSRIEDLNGNAIIFNYAKDATTGECYPTKIEYTVNKSKQIDIGDYSIEFSYETRNNEIITRSWGKSNNQSKLALDYTIAHRLTDIYIKSNGTTIRNYHLEYLVRGPIDQPDFQNHFIEKIQEIGLDGIKYNKTLFQYETEPNHTEYELISKGNEDDVNDYYVDLNSEGGKELILHNPINKTLEIYEISNNNNNYSLTSLTGFYNSVRENISFGDFDGDGLNDIIQWYKEGDDIIFDLWISSSGYNDFSFEKHESVLVKYEGNSHAFVPYFGEFNGDGKTDIMLRDYSLLNTTECTFYFYRNDINQFKYLKPLENSIYSYNSFNIDREMSLLQSDLNGDGRTDYFCYNQVEELITEQGFLFICPDIAENEIEPIDITPNYLPEIIADFNGDGKSDLLYVSYIKTSGNITGYELKVFQSTGKKLIEGEIACSVSLNLPANHYFDKINFRAGEFNLDNHTDIIAITTAINGWGEEYRKMQAFISNVTGNKFTTYSLNYNNKEIAGCNFEKFNLDDLNGDGKSDLITNYIDINNIGGHNIINLNIFNNIDGHKLKSIKNGLGAETKIEYSLLTDNRYYADRGAWPIMTCNLPIPLVDKVTKDNGFGGVETFGYSYSRIRVHPRYGILGFLKTTQGDAVRQTSTWKENVIQEFTGNPFWPELNNRMYKLLPLKTINRFKNGPIYSVLSETNFVFDIITYGNNLKYYYLYLKEQTDKLYETDGSTEPIKVSKTTNEQIDAHGNYGLVTTQKGISTASMPYIETTTSIYNDNTENGKWFLGRLQDATVVKKSPDHPDITRKSSFTYYETNGQLKTETVEPDDVEKSVTKTYVYDDFGNITSTTLHTKGKADRVTLTNYDHNLNKKHGRFVTEMVNAILQTSEKEIDPITGNTLSTTDLNGLKTTYEYDGFGTKTKTVLPDKTQAIATARWCDESDTDKPPFAVYYIWAGSTAQMPVKKYYNRVGVELLTVTYGFDGSKIYNDIAYDDKGRLWKSFLPSYTYPLPADIKFTETKYDDIGRVKEVINPVTTPLQKTTYAYEGLKTSVTNPKGQITSKTCNAAGWVVKSTDANDLSVINEFYSNGKVAKKYIEGKLKTTISYDYDLFGNLSKMIDPDLGTITYTYTGFGELETETNNKNQTTYYVYDNLGRIYTRTDNKETKWSYDISENGVGMISSICIGDGMPHSPVNEHSVIYTYDELSRAIKVDEIIDNTTYTTSTSYDIYGRPEQIVYPSTNYTIKNHYNEFGFFDKVIQASDNKVLWQATAYNEKGQLLQSKAGENLTTIKDYDPLSGSLKSITTGTLQNFGYDFDAIGNLNWRKDIKRNMKEGFTYDNLNRLTHVNWNDAATAKLTMAYDDIGNITYKSDVGYYTYDTDKLHKLKSIDNKPVTISEFDQHIEYTWYDKVSKVWLNDGPEETRSQLQLTYGVDRQRVKQVISKNGVVSTRIYIGGLYEKFTEGSTTEEIHYISSGDGLIAIYTKKNTSSSLVYVLKDHLGSVQLLVNEDNTIDQELSYDPWGLRRDPATWNYLTTTPGSNFNRGFTGHEHLDLFALINMNGRMYDPVLGYFTSPDPIIQFADFTQGLNRYAYCLNNPLSMVDPTGHNAWNVIIPIAAIAAAITVTYLSGGFAAGVLPEILLQSAIFGGAAAGFTGSLLSSIANGCSFQESLVNVFFGTIIGACSALVTYGIGDAFAATSGIGSYLGKAAAHGIKGGLFSFIQGGKFEHGFLSGMASSLSAPLSEGQGMAERVALGVVVGGTVEEIGGGKFANGAVTGAFTVLYNEMMHNLTKPQQSIDYKSVGKSFTNHDEARQYMRANALKDRCEVVLHTIIKDGVKSFEIVPWEGNTWDMGSPLIQMIDGKPYYNGHLVIESEHFGPYNQRWNMTLQTTVQYGGTTGSRDDQTAAKQMGISVTHYGMLGAQTYTPNSVFDVKATPIKW